MKRMGNPEGPISIFEIFTGTRGTRSENALLIAQERLKQHLLRACMFGAPECSYSATFVGFKHSRCSIIHDIKATTSQSSCIIPIVGKSNGQFKKRGNLCHPKGVYPDLSQMVCWIVWRS
jgi:hypothetical protein